MDDLLSKESHRSRATDYIGLARNVVDSYPKELAHGLQKDAIQNGWDARVVKKDNYIQKDWEFRFVLSYSKVKNQYMLEMIDKGTVGLTGHRVVSRNFSDNAYSNLPETERWIRWESLAFKKSEDADSDNLGARGQGKLIFMYASKDYFMSYDSLREDGTYRFGVTTLKNDSPVSHWDEDEAKKMVQREVGLNPLAQQGTRIIIHNLKKEIVEDIQKGYFLKYIEETWWPIILKCGANIIIEDRVSGGDQPILSIAQVPNIYERLLSNPKDDEENYYWVKDKLSVTFNRQNYKMKVYLCYCVNKIIPQHLKGVSYFRGGMKINDIAVHPLDIRDKTYGYVEFSPGLDKLLRTIEESSHYGFKEAGKNGTLWKLNIKTAIEKEIDNFGKTKLNLGIIDTEKQKKIRTKAEKEAMSFFDQYAKNWNLFGASSRTGSSQIYRNLNDALSSSKLKMIGFKLKDFMFPKSPKPRIDIGQSIQDFYLEIFNKTQKYRHIGLRASILRRGDEAIKTLLNVNFALKGEAEVLTNTMDLSVDRSYKPGFYKLKISLFDFASTTKDKIDEITKIFYVNQDPPEKFKAPFTLQSLPFTKSFINLPNRDKRIHREWYLERQPDDSYILYYNTDHPRWIKNKKNPAHYLTEIICMAGLQSVLINYMQNPSEDCYPFDAQLLGQNSDLNSIFTEITRVVSEIRKDIEG